MPVRVKGHVGWKKQNSYGMITDMYSVKLEKFEGPMDLLLELIEDEKVNITELSLARVADQYLEYIQNNQSIELKNLAEFLSVAAKLILIKSRALLPILKFDDEEEAEIKDLAKQLEEYRRFKEASEKIGKLSVARRICYSRESYLGAAAVFFPPENLNAYDLKAHFLNILSEIPNVQKLQEEIVSEVVTLEERINEIENTLRLKIETSFAGLVEKTADKIDVIVSFLAILEMIKQRIVSVEQQDLFSEIRLSIKSQANLQEV